MNNIRAVSVQLALDNTDRLSREVVGGVEDKRKEEDEEPVPAVSRERSNEFDSRGQRSHFKSTLFVSL